RRTASIRAAAPTPGCPPPRTRGGGPPRSACPRGPWPARAQVRRPARRRGRHGTGRDGPRGRGRRSRSLLLPSLLLVLGEGLGGMRTAELLPARLDLTAHLRDGFLRSDQGLGDACHRRVELRELAVDVVLGLQADLAGLLPGVGEDPVGL